MLKYVVTNNFRLQAYLSEILCIALLTLSCSTRITNGYNVVSASNIQTSYTQNGALQALINNLQLENERLAAVNIQFSSEISALQLALDLCGETESVDETHEHSTVQSRIACESSSLNLACDGNKVLHIISANYGRTEPGFRICPHNSIRTISCYSNNAKDIVMNQCQNQKACGVWAANQVFSDPCVSTYKYLEVLFECV